MLSAKPQLLPKCNTIPWHEKCNCIIERLIWLTQHSIWPFYPIWPFLPFGHLPHLVINSIWPFTTFGHILHLLTQHWAHLVHARVQQPRVTPKQYSYRVHLTESTNKCSACGGRYNWEAPLWGSPGACRGVGGGMALTWQMSHGNPASWSCRLAWELPRSGNLNWNGDCNRLNRRLPRPRYTHVLLSHCRRRFVSSMAYARHKQLGMYHAQFNKSINSHFLSWPDCRQQWSCDWSSHQSGTAEKQHSSQQSMHDTVTQYAHLCHAHTATTAYRLSRHNLIVVHPWTGLGAEDVIWS